MVDTAKEKGVYRGERARICIFSTCKQTSNLHLSTLNANAEL